MTPNGGNCHAENQIFSETCEFTPIKKQFPVNKSKHIIYQNKATFLYFNMMYVNFTLSRLKWVNWGIE